MHGSGAEVPRIIPGIDRNNSQTNSICPPYPTECVRLCAWLGKSPVNHQPKTKQTHPIHPTSNPPPPMVKVNLRKLIRTLLVSVARSW
ncbi:MAG: hypothetical protein F6K26_46450 [Moorea sp. SIO2I5]|nr:hypothetical protein [Moorena sp. SIO2I5]